MVVEKCTNDRFTFHLRLCVVCMMYVYMGCLLSSLKYLVYAVNYHSSKLLQVIAGIRQIYVSQL